MKRSKSYDDLEYINTKKRKRNLSLSEVHYIPCEICNDPVYEYKQCIGYHIYWCLECLEVIMLRILNEEKYTSFEDEDNKMDIDC